MESKSGIKSSGFKLWLALVLIEGTAAFLLLFSNPSESGSGILFGFSPLRLLLGFLLLAGMIWPAWTAVRCWNNPARLQSLCSRLNGMLFEKDRLLTGLFLSAFVFLVPATFLFVFSSRISYQFQDFLLPYPEWMTRCVDILRSICGRAFPVIAWTAALGLQTFILILWSSPLEIKKKWQDGSIIKAAIVLLMTGLSLFQWTVLFFHLKTFMAIPGWKWYITPKELQPGGYALYIVFFFLALILFQAVFIQRYTRRQVLVFLIVLGYLMQIAFGFIAGGGFESIRLKYADSVFSGYARAAAEQPPLFETLYHYESLYSSDHYLGTKPPGILIPYVATEKAASLISPSATSEERIFKLTKLAAYTYPLIAFLILPVLAAFYRRLLNDPSKDCVLPAAVFLICPNVILVPLFLDQVLYPLLFLLALGVGLVALDRPSFLKGFLIGVLGYLILYFSFSLLPLIPLVALWTGLEWLRTRTPGSFRRILLYFAGIPAGVLFLWAVFRVGLNYDFVTRYFSAFANHRTTWHFNSPLERIRHGLVLNNAEFVVFTGFPIIVLLIIRSVKAVAAFIRRQASRFDSLTIAFLLMYTVLVVFGQTNGEVQRLYLFLTPLVALFAAEELKWVFRDKKNGFTYLAVLQIITMIMLFHFQDFYG